jgi:DNA-binding protein H-NS
MSQLAEYRALEKQVAEQLAELERLKNNDGLKHELEFEKKLRALLEEYGYSLRNIIAILDPQPKAFRVEQPAAPSTRKARQVKKYKNPHSGEVVETKGGNHKTLKEWKSQYGGDEVESWLQ